MIENANKKMNITLRDRIWARGSLLRVDLYNYYDPRATKPGFNFDQWEKQSVYISMKHGFKKAYSAARLLLRARGMTPDMGGILR